MFHKQGIALLFLKMKKQHVMLVKHEHTTALQAQRSEKTSVSLDNLFEHMKQGEMKELNIIFKADVQGSAEAVAASLTKN